MFRDRASEELPRIPEHQIRARLKHGKNGAICEAALQRSASQRTLLIPEATLTPILPVGREAGASMRVKTYVDRRTMSGAAAATRRRYCATPSLRAAERGSSRPPAPRRSSFSTSLVRGTGNRLVARRDVPPRRVCRAAVKSSGELSPLSPRSADSTTRHQRVPSARRRAGRRSMSPTRSVRVSRPRYRRRFCRHWRKRPPGLQ